MQKRETKSCPKFLVYIWPYGLYACCIFAQFGNFHDGSPNSLSKTKKSANFYEVSSIWTRAHGLELGPLQAWPLGPWLEGLGPWSLGPWLGGLVSWALGPMACTLGTVGPGLFICPGPLGPGALIWERLDPVVDL